MMPLSSLFILGAIVALALDVTVNRIDDRISRLCPERKAVNQPPAQMVEVHDFFTRPLQR